MSTHDQERAPAPTLIAHRSPRPAYALGALQAAGNRAITSLLVPPVQRFEIGEDTDDGPVGEPSAADSAVDSAVDDMAEAIEAGIDGGAASAQLRTDAVGQDGGRAEAGEIPAGGGPVDDVSASEPIQDDDASVQTVRADVQRDGQADPSQPRAASPGDLLEAVLALPSVSAILARLADFAVAQLKKAGAPATVTLGVFFLPVGLVVANQGLGLTKFTFKTPAIDLGGKRSITFKLSVDVDPKTGGAGSLSAEIRF